MIIYNETSSRYINQVLECREKTLMELSKSGFSDVQAIALLDEGWVGEEALTISIYCAL